MATDLKIMQKWQWILLTPSSLMSAFESSFDPGWNPVVQDDGRRIDISNKASE